MSYYELCFFTCGQIKELHSPLVGSVCPTVQVPSALRTFCNIINAHDGDHDEDDVDDSDEVLPVHTNQRQIIDTSVGLLVTAAPSITIAA